MEDSKKSGDEEKSDEEKAEEAKAKELSPEEAASVMNTSDFLSFFDRSSKLVERVLNVKYDPLVDYSANDDEGEG